MSLQLNIWLLLFGGLQGLLLSLALVNKKTYRTGNGFLIAYLLVMIAQILFKVLDKHWLIESSRGTYFLSYKFPFLYGPLVLLFIRQLTHKATPLLHAFIHFLPFVYSVVIINLSNNLGDFGWLHWPMEATPALVLQSVSLIYYHALAFQLWQKQNNGLSPIHADIHPFKAPWVKSFIVSSLFICLAICLLTYFIYTWYPAHNWLRFGFLLLCFFIYQISYSALHQPALFADSLYPEKKLPDISAKKYAHSTLSDAEATRITAALESLMQEQKLFAEPELTIDQLADRLQTSRYVLSQVLNERLGQSFYEYINGWRIAEAQNMLINETFQQYKIAAIGYDAGFNSLSTFNEVFKKTVGVTPSQYKKQMTEREKHRV